MTSALVAGTKKMNIVPMVLVVITTFAPVCDLKQHCCNMVRVQVTIFHRGESQNKVSIVFNETFDFIVCSVIG